MKDNFENTIKQSLEGFEMPYDASAWTALSQKLDVVKPISPAPKNGSGKWIAAAGIVAAISIGAYVYFQSTTNDNENTKNTAETTVSENNTTNKVQLTQNEAKSNNRQDAHADDAKANDQYLKTHDVDVKSKSSNPDYQWLEKSSAKSNTTKGNDEEKQATKGTSTNVGENTSPDSKAKALKVPSIKDLCLGDAINIKNENDSDLILVLPNGKNQVIRKGTSLNTKSKIAGEYRILSNENELASFKVNKLPVLDFTIDDQLIADEGVPTVPVATYSEGSNFTWIAEGISRKFTGKKQDLHFFTSGTKTITLQAENEKGCVGEVTKTIRIEEDYNLFAPNAVNPSSSDRRNNRFMPRALNVRNVEFTMLIVDIKTGLTVYMTSDANEGWDGTDKNTGEMAPEGSVYAWKVHLKNPLPGEASDYKGKVEVTNR